MQDKKKLPEINKDEETRNNHRDIKVPKSQLKNNF